MEQLDTDICVIGAGSGGLSVAAGAVQMGARVVLIEGGAMGGDCLNHGCVPSKALIAAAGAAYAARAGGPLGVTAPGGVAVDFAAAKDHLARVIAQIAPHDSEERFAGLGVRVIRDWARFASPRTVLAGGAEIRARRFVIATGSRPVAPPVPGLDAVPWLTNESIFALRERPRHLIVLGGGPIGVELAQAHRRLGCEVSVIEAERVLGREDPELATIVMQQLRDEGVVVHEGQSVTLLRSRHGMIETVLDSGAVLQGSHLLVATGRRPNLDRLELNRAGVRHDARGIAVDAGLRSSNRRVYALGDVAGLGQFTHLAGYHAGVVLRSALFALPARARHGHIPRVIYTDPELAHVGLDEAAARARHGTRLEVLRVPYGENDRARTQGRSQGLVKVMVVRGRPVGATIAGAQAGELIGLWALVLTRGLKLSAIAGTVFPYPTLGELNKRVASAYFSPRLFGNPVVKRVVRAVQRVLP